MSIVLNPSSAVVSFQPPVYGAECVHHYIITAMSYAESVITEERSVVCNATSVGLAHNCIIPLHSGNEFIFSVFSVTEGIDGTYFNGSTATECCKFFEYHMKVMKDFLS